MSLIPGLPTEIAIQVVEYVEDRGDLLNLRLASTTFNTLIEPRVWADLDLVTTTITAKIFEAILREPRLRSLVRTIRWPSFGECPMKWSRPHDHWDEVLDQPWDTLPPGDIETLRMCGFGGGVEVYVGQLNRGWSVPQALVAIITLLCPNVHTVGLDSIKDYKQGCVRYHTLRQIWSNPLLTSPGADEAGDLMPPITTIRLAPAWCIGRQWSLSHDFPSFLSHTPPVKRLDLTYVSPSTRWTFEGLETQRIFADIEDLRLDPADDGTVAEFCMETREATQVSRPGLASVAEWPQGMVGFRFFLASVEGYFAAKAGSLKRLHWSMRSPALNGVQNSRARPRPWLPSLPLLTSLTHLETDMASLFGRPHQVCHSEKRLVDLLPPSLKVLRLAETWYWQRKPCRHSLSAYLDGLHRNLTGLVQARATFSCLQSVTFFFVDDDDELEERPIWKWWAEMGLARELRWTSRSDALWRGEDPFGVLKADVRGDGVFPDLCHPCVDDRAIGQMERSMFAEDVRVSGENLAPEAGHPDVIAWLSGD